MHKVQLKYGRGQVSLAIPDHNYMGTLVPKDRSESCNEEAIIAEAMNHPIGTQRLRDIVQPDNKVVIVTSDITRPLPTDRILPSVLEELKAGGVAESNITVVFALGSHRPHTEEEKMRLVGADIYHSDVFLLDSNMEDCVNLGTCDHGTPADIFKPVVDADVRVCLGNVEFHYFAGYSGGSKALMPGVSSRRAIQANHSNMVKPEAQAGRLEGNPVREDIDQITDFLPIEFIVNVVLNDKGKIVSAFAGHHRLAHREGCKAIDDMYKIEIEKPADIVVLSPGGFPKDINLYQAQKGLDNAQHAVKDGGIVIWCAAAGEGFGEKNFEEWIVNKSVDEMIQDISEKFLLGAHKAAAIAMVLKRASVYLVSQLEEETVERIGFTHFDSPQSALDHALSLLAEDATVLVMPYAGSTLPFCPNL